MCNHLNEVIEQYFHVLLLTKLCIVDLTFVDEALVCNYSNERY